jgi:hypothetical protein
VEVEHDGGVCGDVLAHAEPQVERFAEAHPVRLVDEGDAVRGGTRCAIDRLRRAFRLHGGGVGGGSGRRGGAGGGAVSGRPDPSLAAVAAEGEPIRAGPAASRATASTDRSTALRRARPARVGSEAPLTERAGGQRGAG